MDICGDNRFEIIAKAKSDFLEATNIALSKDAMKVLDNFLFRCWQIGWLDRYATADTPQTEQTEPSEECKTCEHFKHRPNIGMECEYDTFEQTDCPWK